MFRKTKSTLVRIDSTRVVTKKGLSSKTHSKTALWVPWNGPGTDSEHSRTNGWGQNIWLDYANNTMNQFVLQVHTFEALWWLCKHCNGNTWRRIINKFHMAVHLEINEYRWFQQTEKSENIGLDVNCYLILSSSKSMHRNNAESDAFVTCNVAVVFWTIFCWNDKIHMAEWTDNSTTGNNSENWPLT